MVLRGGSTCFSPSLPSSVTSACMEEKGSLNVACALRAAHPNGLFALCTCRSPLPAAGWTHSTDPHRGCRPQPRKEKSGSPLGLSPEEKIQFPFIIQLHFPAKPTGPLYQPWPLHAPALCQGSAEAWRSESGPMGDVLRPGVGRMAAGWVRHSPCFVPVQVPAEPFLLGTKAAGDRVAARTCLPRDAGSFAAWGHWAPTGVVVFAPNSISPRECPASASPLGFLSNSVIEIYVIFIHIPHN